MLNGVVSKFAYFMNLHMSIVFLDILPFHRIRFGTEYELLANFG